MNRPVLTWLLGAAALLAAFSILGVVMGDTNHEPVAVEPDAKLEGGRQVATFALG